MSEMARGPVSIYATTCNYVVQFGPVDTFRLTVTIAGIQTDGHTCVTPQFVTVASKTDTFHFI